MEEKIVNAGSDVAEKVIEQTVENMDSDNLKYLGAFGLGALAGIMAYRKLVVPAWNWIQEKRKPVEVPVKDKTESEPPIEEAAKKDEKSDVEENSDEE